MCVLNHTYNPSIGPIPSSWLKSGLGVGDKMETGRDKRDNWQQIGDNGRQIGDNGDKSETTGDKLETKKFRQKNETKSRP